MADTDAPADLPTDLDSLESLLMSQYTEAPPAPAEPAPAASPAPTPAPAPAAATAPEPAPQPAPSAAEPPANPAAEPAPAEGFDPTKELDPTLAKNWRIGDDLRVTAQNAVEQTALKVRKEAREAGKHISLSEAEAEAHRRLGLAAPAAQTPAAPQPQPAPEPPAPQVSPLDKLKNDLKTLDERLAELHPTFDAEDFKKATLERQNLLTQQVRLETAEMIAQQQTQQTVQAEIDQAQQQVAAQFGEVLADAHHPFTLAYQGRLQQLIQSAPDDVVGAPDFELRVAHEVAQQFEARNIPVRKASAASAPAPAPAPVTQQPAPAAAPQPQAPAAQPRSAAVPLSGAPASVNPVMGIDQRDNTAEAVQSAVKTADLGALDDLLNGRTPGGNSPGYRGDPRFYPAAA
jgi:hypothetical protein